MSFSSDIKSEICNIDNLSPCCYHAQVYGLVLFAHFNDYNFSFTSENKDVFDFYCDVVKNYLGCIITDNNEGNKKLSVFVDDKASRKKAFLKFGHDPKEITPRINHANIENDCCIYSFLRGVFLSCGFISDPEKGYHLEFVVPFKKLCNDLICVLNELELNPKYIQRKGSHVIYFKDSENIEDFLASIGAQNAALTLMNIKIVKDMKNKVNRKLNFELHNLERTVSAAQNQVECIEYIIEKYGVTYFPENLRKIAMLRLDNQEASLSELESLSEEKLSKSGIKHRLDKIVEFTQKTKESES